MTDSSTRRPAPGHNGGPPLDGDHRPPWGKGDIYRYHCWRNAHRAAWRKPREIVLFRLERAERAGLTYKEYSLEILERGRHLQPEDVEDIARIKTKRQARRRDDAPSSQAAVSMRAACGAG